MATFGSFLNQEEAESNLKPEQKAAEEYDKMRIGIAEGQNGNSGTPGQETQPSAESNLKPEQKAATIPLVPTDGKIVPEEEVQRMKAQQFAQEHPDVLSDDWYNEHPSVNAGQHTRNLMEYWNLTGEAPDMNKIIAARSYGDQSKKDAKLNKKVAAWQDVLNSLGNVISHYVNYRRAKAGNPIANIPQNEKPSQLERLRVADEQMRQRAYTAEINALMDKQKRQDTLEAEQRKYQYALAEEQRKLENQKVMKQYEAALKYASPEAQLKLNKLQKDLESAEYAKLVKKAEAEMKAIDASKYDEKVKAEMKSKVWDNKLKEQKYNNGGSTSKKKKGEYKYKDKEYTDPYIAYKTAAIAKGKRYVSREQFDKRANKYLDEMGIEYNKE